MGIAAGRVLVKRRIEPFIAPGPGIAPGIAADIDPDIGIDCPSALCPGAYPEEADG
jgi:hypothetical protein